MFNTYISPKLFYISGLLTLILFWIFELHFFIFFWCAFLAIVMILFKKRPITQGELNFNSESYLSPINGIIKKVNFGIDHPFFGKELIEIRLLLPIFVEMGLYMPFTGEVAEILNKNEMPFLKYREILQFKFKFDGKKDENILNGIMLKIAGVHGQYLGMKIRKCFLGMLPRIWLMAGDRGGAGANFGFLPFGGDLFIYLPKGTNVLVKENEHVLAGQTIIAQIENCGATLIS